MVLHLSRIPRSTPLGRRAGLIGLGLLVAGLNTGNNLFYLFFTLLAAGELVGFVAVGAVLRRARVELAIAPRGTAGTPMRATLRIANGSRWLPIPPLRWRLRPVGGDEIEVTSPAVPPRGGGCTAFRFVPVVRGRLAFDAVELRTDFPLGLSQRRARLDSWESPTLVLPRSLGGGFERSRRRTAEALGARRATGPGDEAVEAREYRAGDDARRIDWKATARAERFILREPRGVTPLPVEVRFDRSGPPGDAFEERVCRAAGAASSALARGYPVAFRSDDCELPPRSGTLQLRRILEYLALVAAVDERRRIA